MLVISFSIEYRLEQHRAYVPPGVYLLVKCVECSLFLAPDRGLRLTLGLAFGILRSTNLCQEASPQVFFGNMPMAPHTAVIIRVRASLFPGHCATPFVVRQLALLPSFAFDGFPHQGSL
jgi:hypothetical protein